MSEEKLEMSPNEEGAVEKAQPAPDASEEIWKAIPEPAGEPEEGPVRASEPLAEVDTSVPKPAQFERLAGVGGEKPIPDNVDIIMDVPLPITVELGRTTMIIRDILDLGPGSVVELDKVAGEPVDILVNGKLVARGEVVVIDDNFGVRVVDIVGQGENGGR